MSESVPPSTYSSPLPAAQDTASSHKLDLQSYSASDSTLSVKSTKQASKPSKAKQSKAINQSINQI